MLFIFFLRIWVSILYHFPSSWRTSFSIPCSSGLLVTLLVLFYVKMSWFSLWCAGYIFWLINSGLTILFSFSTLEMLLHPLLPFIVSTEKPTNNQITVSLHVTCYCSLATFKVCFLSWDFNSLTMMSLAEGFFRFILLAFLWSSCIFTFWSFIKFSNLLVMKSSNISLLHSPPSPYGIPFTYLLYYLILSHRSLRLYFLFNLFFSLLFMLDN